MGKKTKIGMHCQSVPDHVPDYAARAGAVATKFIGLYRRFPGEHVSVGRPYVPQNEVDGYVMQGANGARAYWQRIREEVLKNKGLVGYWEPLNETSIWNASVAAGFVAFCQELTAIFHGEGLKIIIGGINTGWPRHRPPFRTRVCGPAGLPEPRECWLKLPDEDGGKQIMMIYNASKNADGVSFHEYWWYDSMVGGATLRYRYFHNHLKSKGLKHPPIWITECGVDRGNGIGWRTAYGNDERKYAQEIRKYAAEVQKDGYVRAVFMFTAGPQGWEDFNMTKGVCDNLVGELASLPDWTYEDDPAPEPVPWGDPEDISKYALGFDISEYQGADFDWNAAVRSGALWVGIRIANGNKKDLHFERNWAEAGKRHFLRLVYQTVWPDENGQAASLANFLAGRKPEMGVFAAHDMGGFDSARLARYFEAADRQTGGRVDLYSRKTLLDPLGEIAYWAAGRHLWVAEWPSMPEWPTKPSKWEWGWWAWQFSNKGDIGGKRVDLNLYHGTKEDLRKAYGGQDPEEIEPENKPPKAQFAASCTGLVCNFESGSSDPDGEIVSWDWDFGDGTVGGGEQVTKTYAAGGTYDVTLLVKDDDGATDAVIVAVTVKEPDPEPDYLEQARAKLAQMAETIGEVEAQRKQALDLLAKVEG